jgi:hypothetical protein
MHKYKKKILIKKIKFDKKKIGSTATLNIALIGSKSKYMFENVILLNMTVFYV